MRRPKSLGGGGGGGGAEEEFINCEPPEKPYAPPKEHGQGCAEKATYLSHQHDKQPVEGTMKGARYRKFSLALNDLLTGSVSLP